MFNQLFAKKQNKNVAILGLSYGDEGKAKIVDYIAKDKGVVCRFSGGSNAGHSVVVNGKKTIFRLLPSGALYEDKVCVIGNGVVLDLAVLKTEIEEAVQGTKKRLYISENAHIVMPYHKQIDEAREKMSSALGTTKKGIGPAYEDKMRRAGIRMQDILNVDVLEQRISNALRHWEPILKEFRLPVYSAHSIAKDMHDKYAEYYESNIHDTVEYLNSTNKSIVFEGAQGSFLDIDHGTYPFVTSSSSTIGGVFTGTGISPKKVHEITGVIKAYTTRVGSGPFSTEIDDDVAKSIREIGAEYGSVTKRPRRIGWLDLSETRKAVQINGIDNIAFTKIDVLSHLSELKLKTHSDGFMTVPGWETPISHCKTLKELPKNARNFLGIIEDCIECKLALISVSPDRDDIIVA